MNLIDEDKNVLNEIQGKLEEIKNNIEFEEKYRIAEDTENIIDFIQLYSPKKDLIYEF